MLSETSSGMKNASSVFDQVNTSASATPTTRARKYPAKISVPVTAMLRHQS